MSTNSFTWNTGALSGPGKITLASSASGTVNLGLGGPTLTLSRLIENSGTLTINGPFSTGTLAFSGGSISNLAPGTLNVFSATSPVTFSNSGTNSLANAGIMNVRVIAGNSLGTLTEAVPFTNSGTLNVNAATFSLTGGGTNSGTINIYPGSAFTATTQSFSNTGTINYINGTNSLTVSAQYNNAAAGHINVQAGSLTITGTGATNSGNFNIAAGATLQLNSDYTQSATATITGPGTLVLSSAISNFSGALNSTGSLQITAPITFKTDQNLVGTITLSAPNNNTATISGSSNVLLTGPLIWTRGTMSGSGTTTLPAGHVLNLSGGTTNAILDGRTFINSGTVLSTAILGGVNGATFNNQAGAIFNAVGDLSWTSGAVPVFNNAGLLEKTSGVSTYVSWFLNNSGSVQVQSGTLNLNGGGTGTGMFNIAAGTTLGFTGFTHNLNAGAAVGGTGMLTVSGGTVNFNTGSSLTVTGALTISGGTLNVTNTMLTTPSQVLLTGGGTLNITGDKDFDNLVWTAGTLGGSGTTTISAGGTFNFSGNGPWALYTRTLKNLGTITWSGAGSIGGNYGAVIQNTPGAAFDVQNDAPITYSYSGGFTPVFNNAGLLKKSAGTGITSVAWTFNNSGTVQIQTGTLSLSGDGNDVGNYDIAAGATLEFAGGMRQFAASASITGSGAITITGGTFDITGDNPFVTSLGLRDRLSAPERRRWPAPPSAVVAQKYYREA